MIDLNSIRPSDEEPPFHSYQLCNSGDDGFCFDVLGPELVYTGIDALKAKWPTIDGITAARLSVEATTEYAGPSGGIAFTDVLIAQAVTIIFDHFEDHGSLELDAIRARHKAKEDIEALLHARARDFAKQSEAGDAP